MEATAKIPFRWVLRWTGRKWKKVAFDTLCIGDRIRMFEPDRSPVTCDGHRDLTVVSPAVFSQEYKCWCVDVAPCVGRALGYTDTPVPL